MIYSPHMKRIKKRLVVSNGSRTKVDLSVAEDETNSCYLLSNSSIEMSVGEDACETCGAPNGSSV